MTSEVEQKAKSEALSTAQVTGRVFAIIFCVAVLLITSLHEPSSGTIEEEMHSVGRVYPDPVRITIEDREVIWQMPTKRGGAGSEKIQGVVLLLHGCNHQAGDFFVASENFQCPTCRGLPEERRIARALLGNYFGVIALSSKGSCWSPTEDVIPIARALEEMYGTERLVPTVPETGGLRRRLGTAPHAPLFVFGASSGGSLASMLYWRLLLVPPPGGKTMLPSGGASETQLGSGTPLRVSASAVEISGFSIELTSLGSIPLPPPTLFIHMLKDKYTAQQVERSVHGLQELGVEAASIGLGEERIDEQFFQQRTRLSAHPISGKMSKQIYNSLKDNGFIDPDGLLLVDPRASSWRDVLVKDVPGIAEVDSLEVDRSGISEILNVAWAFHEMSSAPMTSVINFFKDHRE
mmetsp:Transcript_16153/g.61608  ORF Transcript_16153/g.61608 Transcript_16153/m.61608 type:complete len:407 (-) Transcript_16153:291-1511(-)